MLAEPLTIPTTEPDQGQLWFAFEPDGKAHSLGRLSDSGQASTVSLDRGFDFYSILINEETARRWFLFLDQALPLTAEEQKDIDLLRIIKGETS
jgi:hypothetical protein